VYSAHYPQNFDQVIDDLQKHLKWAMGEDAPERYAFVYDLRRGSKQVRPPVCRSCFDLVADVDPLGFHHPVICNECNSTSGPVEVTADGAHQVVIEVPQGFEKGFRSSIRHLIRNHECTLCKQITGKKCGACASYYCSKECQRKDWKRHKTECVVKRKIDERTEE
jgi:hypothetical protein